MKIGKGGNTGAGAGGAGAGAATMMGFGAAVGA